MRNIASDSPALYIYPDNRIVVSPTAAYPPKTAVIWIKALAGTCRPARGAIPLAKLTGERTRFPRSTRSHLLSLFPLIMFNICLFFSARVNEKCGSGQVPKKNQVHCDRWLVSTIYPVANCLRGDRGRSNFARDPDEEARGLSISSWWLDLVSGQSLSFCSSSDNVSFARQIFQPLNVKKTRKKNSWDLRIFFFQVFIFATTITFFSNFICLKNDALIISVWFFFNLLFAWYFNRK